MPLTQRQIVESILPEVEIKEITIETPESGEGQVFYVDYSIYDVVEKNQISRFFTNPDFEKYLKVSFSYSKTPDRDYHSLRSRRLREVRTLSEILGEENFKETKLDDGTSIREFSYRQSYSFPKKCKYLEFFARSYVDIDGIEEELGLDPQTFTIQSDHTTKTDLVVVMKDGTLDAKRINFNYHHTDENLDRSLEMREWRGKVHIEPEYNENGDKIKVNYYTAGLRDLAPRIKLEKTEIPFNEIQDFQKRASRQSGRYNDIDFDFLTRQFSNVEEESIRRNTRVDMQKSSTSSQMWMSRTVSGAVNFMFCIDLRNLLIKESQYNYYFDSFSEDVIKSIVDRTHISNLRIFKRRVAVHQTPTAPVVVDYKDDEYKNEFVVESSKRPNTTMSPTRSDYGAIRQVDLPQEPNLMFFTGTDYSMSNITDGNYCYGYEVKIIDPTKQFLSEEILKLQPTLSTLESVYEYLLNSGGEKYYDSRIDNFKPESIQELEIDLRNFSLTPEEVFEEEGQVYSLPEFMLQVVRKYQKTFNLFKDRESSGLNGYALAGLYAAASVKPQAVKMIIEMYESLISRLTRIIGVGDIKNDIYSGKSSISGNFIQEITSSRIYDEIGEIIDANIPRGNGINYLDDPSVEFEELSTFDRELSQVGLRVISGATWERRQISENLRFFNQQYANISLPVDDTMSVQSFDLTAGGSEFLTPSVYHVNNRHLQNNIEDRERPEVILDLASSFTLTRPNISPSVPMPTPPAPAPYEPPRSAMSPSQRPVRDYRNFIATSAFSPYNVVFEDYERLTSSIERFDISAAIQQQIENCINERTQPIDSLDGWVESESDADNVSITVEDDVPASSRARLPFGATPVLNNFGVNIFSNMRSSFLSPSGISTGNFTVTPAAVQSQRPISSSFDISRDNFATSFISSIPSADRVPMISRLPNQLKAILLSSVPDQQSLVNRSFSVSSSPFGTYEVSVGFLASIEYFAGFGKRSAALVSGLAGIIEVEGQGNSIERSDIGSPVWLPLSAQVYAENKDQLLLCRIKKEHFEDLGIRTGELGIPTYDSYFLIKPLQGAAIDTNGVSVEASRNARAIEAVRSEVSRRMEETELDKARLLRQIENLKQENERLHEQYQELNNRVREYNTEMGIIFSGEMNYNQNPPGLGANQASYDDNYFRANMKTSPRTRYFELRSLVESTQAARDRLHAQRMANEEIIAGYELAISQASSTEIDTVEDVNREYFNLQADIQTISNEITSVAQEKRRIIEAQDALLRDDRYIRTSHAMRNDPTYEPNFYDLNADGRITWQVLQDQIIQKDEELMELQERRRELQRIADEGEYL